MDPLYGDSWHPEKDIIRLVLSTQKDFFIKGFLMSIQKNQRRISRFHLVPPVDMSTTDIDFPQYDEMKRILLANTALQEENDRLNRTLQDKDRTIRSLQQAHDKEPPVRMLRFSTPYLVLLY